MARPKDRPFDPSRDVMLDARNLRGLAHPLRLKLLGLLREDGPATATSLAARLGESSGATSYHLRQLAEYGFIRDSGVPSSGRERPWEAAHQYAYFEATEDADETTRLLGTEYLRAVARADAARMESWVDGLETLPPAWREVGTISDYRLRLAPDEAAALVDELNDLAERYRDKVSADAGATGATVSLQFQVLPVIGDETTSPEDDDG